MGSVEVAQRDVNVIRFDRGTFEYLSKETLWTAKECLCFATNIEMYKNNLYKDDYWCDNYIKIYRKYEIEFLNLCDSKKLIAYDKGGRFGKILGNKEYTDNNFIYDNDGNIIETINIIEDTKVFFYKTNLLRCLKDNGVEADENNLWSSVEEKVKVLRPEQETRFIIQGIGIVLRAENPDMTLADMARHELVQKNGGSAYSEKTVSGWLSGVDSRSPGQKTGPKPKTP